MESAAIAVALFALLYAFVQGPTSGWRSWPILSGFHPSLQPYQAYCDQVREELLAIVEGQQTGEEPAAGEEQS